MDPHSDDAPSDPLGRASETERSGAAPPVDDAWDADMEVAPGWQVPWPEPPSPRSVHARNDRIFTIATTVCTSAGVALIVVWLWGSFAAPRPDHGSVIVSYEALTTHDTVTSEGPAGESTLMSPAAADADEAAAVRKAADVSDAGDLPRGDRQDRATNVGDAPRLVPAKRESGLLIVSEPEGARVTINGVSYGKTPTRIHYLPSGAKRIRATKDGFDTEDRYFGPESSMSSRTLRIVMHETPPKWLAADSVSTADAALPRRY